MKTFLTLSASQSKDLDKVLYRNAFNLAKDAELIARSNNSYSRGTSLLVLSLEELVKAILIKLHSEGMNVYKLDDARKFFKDHKVRHQIAQLIEMGSGILESHEKWTLLQKTSEKRKNFFSRAVALLDSGTPLLASFHRIGSLSNFNELKNNGLYVGFQDTLLDPEKQITVKDYNLVHEILRRTLKFYKTLIIYHPMMKNRNDSQILEKQKKELEVLVNTALADFKFEEKKPRSSTDEI